MVKLGSYRKVKLIISVNMTLTLLHLNYDIFIGF